MVTRALTSLDTDLMICDQISALTEIVKTELTRTPSDKIKSFVGELWDEIKQKSTEDNRGGYGY